jgi:hypothetical protein
MHFSLLPNPIHKVSLAVKDPGRKSSLERAVRL